VYRALKNWAIGANFASMEGMHDRSRMVLLFNIAFSVSLLGLIAAVVSLIIGTYPVLVPALGNLFFGILTIVLIRWTGDFQLAAKIYFPFLFLLLFGNLNFNPGTMHVGSPFWVMLLNIMVLYILGLRWGIGFIVASVLGFVYYLHFVLPETMEIMPQLAPETYRSAYYETVFALFLLAYIIATILKSSRESDKVLKVQNEALMEQVALVRTRDEEKTVMLKEIHHRVKNNLQVITSLLRLQMRELTQEEAISKFRDSTNRVLTMALIHEKMYQSEELSRIGLEDYFQGLAADLKDSYQIDVPVQLDIDCKIEKVGLKSIVPLALIFNELFSNSLKHAFEGSDQGKIQLKLHPMDGGNFVWFEYADNGQWKAPKSDYTFGLELIASLTDQLEGRMEMQTIGGTRFIFHLKNLED
jgi:two-component system, sensor histidine kinase PdtaS